jgi:lipoic acid synthetase
MNDELTVLDLGMHDYEQVWRFQKGLVNRRIAEEIPDTLILVEHLPVFTVGRAANLSPSPFPEGKGELPSLFRGGAGGEVFIVERGGDITFHGPGQLVGYPIIDLRERGRDVHRFLHDLEELLILTLKDFEIDASRRAGFTGVWTGSKKIASLGIAVRHWVSYHGFALNVSTDLRYFRMIHPCGLDGAVMTSMAEQLGREVSLAEVKPRLLEHWEEIFRSGDCKTNVTAITPEY